MRTYGVSQKRELQNCALMATLILVYHIRSLLAFPLLVASELLLHLAILIAVGFWLGFRIGSTSLLRQITPALNSDLVLSFVWIVDGVLSIYSIYCAANWLGVSAGKILVVLFILFWECVRDLATIQEAGEILTSNSSTRVGGPSVLLRVPSFLVLLTGCLLVVFWLYTPSMQSILIAALFSVWLSVHLFRCAIGREVDVVIRLSSSRL